MAVAVAVLVLGASTATATPITAFVAQHDPRVEGVRFWTAVKPSMADGARCDVFYSFALGRRGSRKALRTAQATRDLCEKDWRYNGIIYAQPLQKGKVYRLCMVASQELSDGRISRHVACKSFRAR